MNNSDIQSRFEKAREFDAAVRGFKFKFRFPTDFEERKLFLGFSNLDEQASSHQWLHDVLLLSLIGWDGIAIDDVFHDGDKNPFPFSKENARAWIENDSTIFGELSSAFMDARLDRNEKREAAAKNSASA